MRLVVVPMEKYILQLICCLFILSSSGVKPTREDLKWSNLQEISLKLKQLQKPVLIDLYTDWRHWCKVMDKKTYTNQKVIDYLTENLYIAKVNAKSKTNIPCARITYNFNTRYFVNDFALDATNGSPSFPSTVILTNDKTQPSSISGYLNSGEIKPVLKYVQDQANLQKTYSEYKQTVSSSMGIVL